MKKFLFGFIPAAALLLASSAHTSPVNISAHASANYSANHGANFSANQLI